MHWGLARKELRELAGPAALALGSALLLVSGYTHFWPRLLHRADGLPEALPFNGELPGAIFWLVAITGIVLALAQSLPEIQRGTWQTLLHFPLPRRRVLATKVVLGLALIAAVGALPILGVGWWLSLPGTHLGPFAWAATVPAWLRVMAGGTIYLGTLYTAFRPGRWFGGRALPLLGVLLATQLVGWAALDARLYGVAAGCLLLLDLWLWRLLAGTALPDPRRRELPPLDRLLAAALLAVAAGWLYLGAVGWLAQTLRVGQAVPLVLQYDRVDTYREALQVRPDGEAVVQSTHRRAGKSEETYRHLDGRPAKGVVRWLAGQSFPCPCSTAKFWSEPGWRWRARLPGEAVECMGDHDRVRWYLLRGSGDTAWYLGYDLATGGLRGALDRRGFHAGTATPAAPFRGWQRLDSEYEAANDRWPVRDEDGLWVIDPRRRTVSHLRALDPDDLVDAYCAPVSGPERAPARDRYQTARHELRHFTLRTAHELLLLAPDGKVEVRLTQPPGSQPDSSFTLYRLEPGGYFLQRSVPAARDDAPESRSTLFWLDSGGAVRRRKNVVLRRPKTSTAVNWIELERRADRLQALLGAPAWPAVLRRAVAEYDEPLLFAPTRAWPKAAEELEPLRLPLALGALLSVMAGLLCWRRQRRAAQRHTWLWVPFVLLTGPFGLLGYLGSRDWPELAAREERGGRSRPLRLGSVWAAIWWKELRQTAPLLLLAVGALVLWLRAFTLMAAEAARYSDGVLNAGWFSSFGGLTATLTVVFGIVQWQLDHGNWQFLLHRPVARRRLVLVKLAFGCAMAVALPALAGLWLLAWLSTPGHLAAPFAPWMLAPLCWAVAVQPLAYLAGAASGLRQANWFATRLAPAVVGWLAASALQQTPCDPRWCAALTAALTLLLLRHVLWVAQTRSYE